MLSIILPAYNEEEFIRQNALRLIKKMNSLSKKYEILIIEESSDRTPEISGALAKKYKVVRHFHFDRRLGKGRAIEEGIKRAKGDKIIFMDVDLAVGLSAIDTMLSALENYDVAVGSRYHQASKTKRTFLRLFLGRSYALLSSLALRINLRDFQCGFKGFSKQVGMGIIKRTKISGVFWDTEFLYIAKKKGCKITEIPIVWEEKKARSTKIGIKTIFYMGKNLIELFVRSWIG